MTDFIPPKMPDFSFLSKLHTPMPKIDMDKFRRRDLASDFYEEISDYIIDFEKTLDDNHEVGARLVSFGQMVSFHITDIGYSNPCLITFSGVTAEGDPLKLVQHVSQISVLFTSVAKSAPERKSIGYVLKERREKEGGE